MMRGVLLLILRAAMTVLSYLPYPATNLVVCAGAVYGSCYYLFGTENIDDTTEAGEPPTRQRFFAYHYQHLLALVHDKCIICREEPTTPVQVQPCGHIFCDEHIREWFDRGHRRCPQCTQKLFVESNGKEEMLNKVFIATCYVNFVVTSSLLLFKTELRRIDAITAGVVESISVSHLIQFWQDRENYGGRWWRHTGGNVDDEDTEGVAIMLVILAFAGLWYTAGVLLG